MKKLLIKTAIILSFLLCTTISLTASAIDIGACGDNLIWTLDDDGVLTISGEGDMFDWSSETDVPWYVVASKITSVIIENNVTKIGSYAFSECWNITNITLPESINEIGEYAFYFTKVTDLAIPQNVTVIKNYTFANCQSLLSVTIPDSVTAIEQNAFAGCTKLQSLNLPQNLSSIGTLAFYNCTSLTNITVDENNAHYTSDNGVLFDKNKTILIIYPAKKSATSYYIPETVNVIGEYAFLESRNLKYVNIPSSVTTIKKYAFYKCSSLTSLSLPDSITKIEAGAFCMCSKIPSVTLPYGITSIEDGTFHTCQKLSNISIPDTVTYIGKDAFTHCNFTSITLPVSITSIGDSAFKGCDLLTEVNYNGYKKDWLNIKIGANNSYLTNATLYYLPISLDTQINNENFAVIPNGVGESNCLVSAYYKNDKLSYIIKHNPNDEISIPFTKSEIYNKVKVMVWESFGNPTPLCETKEIAIN